MSWWKEQINKIGSVSIVGEPRSAKLAREVIKKVTAQKGYTDEQRKQVIQLQKEFKEGVEKLKIDLLEKNLLILK